ncbi:MAG TPA: M55 family metallopeptidase [bacterium]|nr:M55 family metallopeptidase [bacterium]HPR86788.1 M55 family metallopeptidase [bacterium]
MKLYITADMEGVNGVVLREHVDPAAREYEMARGWMIAEVNAAIEGAVAGGATELLVNDSHNAMANLLVDRLHPAARLVSGPGKPFSMMQEVDASCAGAFFLGYHAAFGTPLAVLDHTWAYSYIEDIRINGVHVGEFGLNAGLAGFYQVPALLVTGDRALVSEARTLLPGVGAVAVKEGRGRLCAVCEPFQNSLVAIRRKAEMAVRHIADHRPLLFAPPLTLEVDFPKAEMAEAAMLLPGAGRQADRSVICRPADYPELYRQFLALFRLAKSV